MEKTIEELGYCGENCEPCQIYRATVYGETLPLEVIKQWQEDIKKYHGVDSVTAEQLRCHGCRYEGDDDFFTFKRCPIRGCCKSREIISCKFCPEIETCPWKVDPSRFS